MSDATRFRPLFVALLFLILVYPYFPENEFGALLGGLVSLALLSTAVHACRGSSRSFRASLLLALVAAGLSVAHFVRVDTPGWATELSFALFYGTSTWIVFRRVISVPRVTRDTILGTISVYLLIGVTFGNLYDFVETVEPGSFALNTVEPDPYLGFRRLLFFSFMTLTSVGYGDITPRSTSAQSLAIVEGVTGILYVAVLVSRIVGLYRRGEGSPSD